MRPIRRQFGDQYGYIKYGYILYIYILFYIYQSRYVIKIRSIRQQAVVYLVEPS